MKTLKNISSWAYTIKQYFIKINASYTCQKNYILKMAHYATIYNISNEMEK
jgi:hypothetical protein